LHNPTDLQGVGRGLRHRSIAAVTAGGRRGNALRVLRLGSTRVDKGALLIPELGPGIVVDTPVYAYLLETADGRTILVDTGMNPVHIAEPHAGFDPGFAQVLTPIMDEPDRLEARLAAAGVDVGDVSAVINTHLHFDHAGGNALFAGVPIHVQRAHHAHAVGNPECPNENWNLPALEYELLDGELELFDGVRTIVTPGHTPGHQSLLITLRGGGHVLLCADAILSQENVERDSWTSQADPETARASGRRLLEIAAAHDAFVIFGHDPVQAGTLRYAPASYV
jgi:N-acyl homoserine lactone hydrolase